MKTKEQVLQYTLVCHGQFIPRGSRTWDAVIEAMEDYRNQPSGEGVKSPERYLEGFGTHVAYKHGKPSKKFINLVPTNVVAVEDAISALTAQARDMDVKLYDPKKNRPKQNPDDIRFSVDVFTIDEEGLHGIAYFHFAQEEWVFLTDTLVDYNELDNETEWRWYYPPVTGFRNDRSKPKESPICCCDTDVICNLHWRGE